MGMAHPQHCQVMQSPAILGHVKALVSMRNALLLSGCEVCSTYRWSLKVCVGAGTAAVDVYGFGCVLWQILTGETRGSANNTNRRPPRCVSLI